MVGQDPVVAVAFHGGPILNREELGHIVNRVNHIGVISSSERLAFGDNRTSGPLDVATAVNAHGAPHGRQDFESETFVAHSLRAEGFDASEDGTGRGTPLVSICFSGKDHGADASKMVAPTLRSMGHNGSHANGGGQLSVSLGSAVRRLTPLECERLQGFPDRYTNVPFRGKPATDGPRYKALGNSIAVNCIRWIGQRIAMVDAIDLRFAA